MYYNVSDEEVLVASKGNEVLEDMYNEMQKFIRGEWSKEYFSNKRYYESLHKEEVKESIENEKTEIAKKLITMDMGTKDIVQATGLSIEAIELLQKEVKN